LSLAILSEHSPRASPIGLGLEMMNSAMTRAEETIGCGTHLDCLAGNYGIPRASRLNLGAPALLARAERLSLREAPIEHAAAMG